MSIIKRECGVVLGECRESITNNPFTTISHSPSLSTTNYHTTLIHFGLGTRDVNSAKAQALKQLGSNVTLCDANVSDPISLKVTANTTSQHTQHTTQHTHHTSRTTHHNTYNIPTTSHKHHTHQNPTHNYKHTTYNNNMQYTNKVTDFVYLFIYFIECICW